MKAFPKMNEKQPSYQTGMDLRDWFAGLALPECVGWGEPEEVCALAYRYADEMMKARLHNDSVEEKTSVPKD